MYADLRYTEKTYRNFLLHADKLGDLINHLILNQGAIHVKNSQSLMPTEHALFL